MRFHTRRRQRAPTIIIVALIDILIVLLIFLLVTTTFRQQPALKLTLPESAQAKGPGVGEHAPLIISIDPLGGLRFGRENRPATVDQLKSELMLAVQKDPELKLAIRADEGAPWGKVLKVMDLARGVGIKSVSALANQPRKP